jgi:hypothetical protein
MADKRKTIAVMSETKNKLKVTEEIEHCSLISSRSRGSSFSIVPNYGLDDRDSVPGRGRGLFF